MISKYITENGKFRQIDEFMPGTWINLTAPTQDESLEIARRYNVDLADIRAALDDEESSRVITVRCYVVSRINIVLRFYTFRRSIIIAVASTAVTATTAIAWRCRRSCYMT